MNTDVIEVTNIVGSLRPVKPEVDENIKDIIFYFIILNMQSFSLLNRLYTYLLEELLENSITDKQKATDIIQKLKRYPLSSKPSGICMIFSMHERRGIGALADNNIIETLLKEELHYDTVSFVNPTKDDLTNAVIELKAERYKFYNRYANIE